MYENGTMRSLETILRREGRRINENDRRGESKISYKYFYKCHNVPPEQG
jgi:hypothetical protein